MSDSGVVVGLIRGVNVGGKHPLPMAHLRRMLEELGLESVSTHLQSGNFVGVWASPLADLEIALSRVVAAELDFEPIVIVRSMNQWKAMINANPFPDFAEKDPSHLQVYLRQATWDHENVKSATGDYSGPEKFQVSGGALFVTYPDGIGKSKLERHGPWRKLTAQATARNWNTVVSLDRLAASVDR